MDYFNSRPSARGDISTGLINPLKSLFQFTPLREGRRLRRSQQRLSHLFQFTPLREGRRVRTFVFVAGNISIHAPPRGATHRQSAGNCSKSNFNSRPSARGDRKSGGLESVYNISIHAPPRGATRWAQHVGVDGQISIHAPPRGATKLQVTQIHSKNISIHAPPRGATKAMNMKKRFLNFNSRPSARGDHRQTPLFRRRRISIHAPPRGATSPPHEYTQIFGAFQFTPLREGRHVIPPGTAVIHHFNSRPSARGDARRSQRRRGIRISIHAPPRGATHRGSECFRAQVISIHAPPRGATEVTLKSKWKCIQISIHAPPRGATACPLEAVFVAIISIHAPPRGATAASSIVRGLASYFNSRPSARGDLSTLAGFTTIQISIHAPPRGATRWLAYAPYSTYISIHAPPRGATAGMEGVLRMD